MPEPVAVRGSWVLTDTLQFVNNLFLSLNADEPLNILLPRVFTEVIGKMLYYANCTHGLHLFANTPFSGEVLEAHYLYIDQDTSTYLTAALKHRYPFKPKHIDAFELGQIRPPQYLPTYFEAAEGIKQRTELNDLLSNCHPYIPNVHETTHWQNFLNNLNKNAESRANTVGPGHEFFRAFDCKAKQLLVIPLTQTDRKLPAGQLGTVLLWNNRDAAGSASHNVRHERLIPAAKVFSVFIQQLLKRNYGMSADTYLPSYRLPGPRSVGIMFADIRGFTPATEVMRNFGLVPELTEFMVRYCSEMCKIIVAHNGRVNGMAGDGIMALFGEYALDDRQIIQLAVKAAMEMYNQFQGLKKAFFGTKRIEKFFQNEYEPMDLDLGIGLNYGPVIFEYLGTSGYRTYSAIGDHVNFAQRLESQANRFDVRLSRKRAPILASRPVWRLAGYPSGWEPVTIEVKGKPNEYQAYECKP
jgi:class 3 adenylate cyclase